MDAIAYFLHRLHLNLRFRCMVLFSLIFSLFFLFNLKTMLFLNCTVGPKHLLFFQVYEVVIVDCINVKPTLPKQQMPKSVEKY